MACEVRPLGDRGIAIVCSRGPQPSRHCTVCGARLPPAAVKLCDGEVGQGRTCNRVLCASCAFHVNPDTDYCPTHKPISAGAIPIAQPLVWEVVAALDQLDRPVTAFEAGVLETLLRTKRCSPKQLRIVCQMAERYLPDGGTLAAELQGQQRML